MRAMGLRIARTYTLPLVLVEYYLHFFLQVLRIDSFLKFLWRFFVSRTAAIAAFGAATSNPDGRADQWEGNSVFLHIVRRTFLSPILGTAAL